MQLQTHVAFVVLKESERDRRIGYIDAPWGAPPILKRARGYAWKTASGTQLDVAALKEKVLIICHTEVAQALKLEATKDSTSTGIYQRLPSGQLAVLLPFENSDKRRQRSELWRQYWPKLVERAFSVAAGIERVAEWPDLVTGEGSRTIAALKRILAHPQPVATDVETAGDMPDMAITAIGLGAEGVSVSVPWDGYHSKAFGRQAGLESTEIRDLVLAILASREHPKVFHNGNFDLAAFKARGIEVSGDYEDTILLQKIIFPELYRNLQFCAGMAAVYEPWKDLFKNIRDKTLKAKGNKKQLKKAGIDPKDWHEIPLDALLTYNCKDAAATLAVWKWLKPRLVKTHMGEKKYADYRQLAIMAAEMWQEGIGIDTQLRDKLWKDGRKELAAIVMEWRRVVGPGIPLFGTGSAKKLSKLFFETYKAPVIVRSPTTKLPSLNTYSLTCWDVGGRQPLSDAAFTMFRQRKLKKNLDAFLKPLEGKDRVYASPNVTGTVGTRLSYSKPNLQQWAKDQKTTRFTTGKKYKLAPNVRQLVVADPGCVLVEADYNALEARAVAYRTNNEMWFDWMRTGRDMHVEHVDMMYGIRLVKGADGEWDDPNGLRQVTKVTTYARFYNEKGNPEPVVRMLKSKMPSLTTEAVEEVFERFDSAIPHIVKWHADMKRRDKELGFIETGIGGWRLLLGEKPDANRARSFEIQSTVGEVVLQAMLLLRKALQQVPGASMKFMVHDSFVVQCREQDVLLVGKLIRDSMEWCIPSLWGHKNVVFPTDIKYGPNWSQMEKLKLVG